MPDEFDDEAAAHQVAETSARLSGILTPIDEATLGYRHRLEAEGWSPTAAEQMALGFYGLQVTALMGDAGQTEEEPPAALEPRSFTFRCDDPRTGMTLGELHLAVGLARQHGVTEDTVVKAQVNLRSGIKRLDMGSRA